MFRLISLLGAKAGQCFHDVFQALANGVVSL